MATKSLHTLSCSRPELCCAIGRAGDQNPFVVWAAESIHAGDALTVALGEGIT